MIGRIVPRAAVIGGIVDLGVTFACSIVVGSIVSVSNGIFDLPPSEQEAALNAAMLGNRVVFLGLIVLGSLSSVLGGFVAASVARRDALINGAASGGASLLLGLYSIGTGAAPFSLVVSILMLPLGPALGMIGGHLWSRGQVP